MIAYYKWEKAIFDDKIILDEIGRLELGEEVPNNKAEFISWDELENFCRKLQWFRVEKTRKGRVFCNPIEILVKEWREPNFSIYHEISYCEGKPTIMDILNYPDIEKAAQYLREHEINIMEESLK